MGRKEKEASEEFENSPLNKTVVLFFVMILVNLMNLQISHR